MANWALGLITFLIGVACSAIGWWWKDRVQITREERTAARLLEGELLEIAIRLESLWTHFEEEWKHLETKLKVLESPETVENFRMLDARGLSHPTQSDVTEEGLLRIYAVAQQLPVRLPSDFPQWDKHSPTLARAIGDEGWREVTSAYSAIQVARLLPDLVRSDLGDSISDGEGSAWDGILREVREKVRKAIEALSQVAGDSHSSWPETMEMVDTFFKHARRARRHEEAEEMHALDTQAAANEHTM